MMNSAYLYVRVSTDEQKRKGYSLPEQEDRLLRYCEQNNIEVRGIYREDYSAKNFNRPEWTKLLNTLKSRKKKDQENILFIKWGRFSRNIEYGVREYKACIEYAYRDAQGKKGGALCVNSTKGLYKPVLP
jgi:DNA invertase Pin-like site-specific DNA recombinase